jgi:hypothetical protein
MIFWEKVANPLGPAAKLWKPLVNVSMANESTGSDNRKLKHKTRALYINYFYLQLPHLLKTQ